MENFQWTFSGVWCTFVKYSEVQKKAKRYPSLKMLLGCSPGRRLRFECVIRVKIREINLWFIPAWVWIFTSHDAQNASVHRSSKNKNFVSKILHLMIFGDLDPILISMMPKIKCFFCAKELKNRLFENLHLVNFGNLDLILTSHDAEKAFSMHRSSKIDF